MRLMKLANFCKPPAMPQRAQKAYIIFALLIFLSLLLFQPRAALAQTELFFSEYIEGSGFNKALEIYNGTGAAVNLATGAYMIQMYFNGSTSATLTITLTGTVANGDVYVVAPTNATDATILAQADQLFGTSWFNGNDAVVLRKGGTSGTIVDVIGQVGFDPGTEWGTGLTSTADNTLRRKATIIAGDTNPSDAFDPSIEWDGFATNTFAGLGSHTVADAAPSVTGTTPSNGATNVAVNTNITINFSEPVNVAGSWFSISGGSSGAHAATVSGGPQNFTLDPDVDFANGETVTITVFAANVTDQDASDPPDNMAADFVFSFMTIAGDVAPSVMSTTPVNGASGVALNTDITINFDEPVNVSGSWFSITGSSSGAHTATVSGGPTSFTLNPDLDFSSVEIITVTVFAANVADQDAIDPPDNMAADFTFSFATTGILINEILADPHPTNGDANGDGTVNTTQDEFVEIINTSGASLDISGWTLSDAVGVRHTFPSGTILADQCGAVIFAGGTPAGAFGNTTVQVASTGQLGLNNAGDTVTLKNGTTVFATYTFGSEGGNDQSLTRNPDITGSTPLVRHTTATGAAGRLHSPGTKVDGTQFSGCPPLITIKEIFAIQGSGLASPFANQTVTTKDNVVTAVAANGFFIQTPVDRSDGNSQTSDGIFVFTGGGPSVSVGDRVDVTGNVIEFFNFTEFSNGPTVTVLSSGNPLPPAVQFDTSTPTPNQPQSATEYERFEGMLVQIASGVVAGSNQAFGTDPIAEVFVVAGPNRPFREPGIQYPGLSGLPVWDGNPEIFEFDPDRLGQPNLVIPAGSTFSATGVLGFEFSDYEFWPTQYSINAATLPRAVRARNAGESTIATLNLHQFYDIVNDPGVDDNVPTAQEYADKLNKLSMYIRTLLDAPDILAVQEAEKLGVLQDLANKIHSDEASLTYAAYLVEGNDVSGIDVGFLVRDGVTVNAVTQLGATEIFTFDNTRLHDRPPLFARGHFGGRLQNFRAVRSSAFAEWHRRSE